MRELTMQRQTKLHNPNEGIRGNCMVTCYANYLGFKVEQCPRFEELFDCTKPEGFWWDCVIAWWKHHGYDLHYVSSEAEIPADILDNDYVFVSGISPRNPNVHHLVIYKNGKMVFDPHPSGAGIVAGTERGYEYVVPIQ